MALETNVSSDTGQKRAIMELQRQRFFIATGAAPGGDIAVPGIKTTDTVATVLNLTDLTSIDKAAVKAELACETGLDSVLAAHAAGAAGNSLQFTLVGDSAQPVKASFGGAAWAGGYDAVLEAHTGGVAGNDWKVVMVGDSGVGAGVTVNVNAGTKTVTIHYESGVSTVADVNTAITALAGADDVVDVKTAGTGATVLTSPNDNVGVTNLEGGVDGAGVIASVSGSLLTVHYQSGVSTVAQVEAAIAALAGADDVIDVKTAGTGATVLTAPADNITAAAFAGGSDAITAEAPTIPSNDAIRFASSDTAAKKLLVIYWAKPTA